MQHLRKHGEAPYSVAVVHGGPGAAGRMAPVARRLGRRFGVLEPIQSAATVEGQVAELAAVLQEHARLPVQLIGHSWGAWLSLIVGARHPGLVGKLILVGSGPFEEKYAAAIGPTRMSRLGAGERREYEALLRALAGAGEDRARLLARLGELTLKTDTYAACGDEADLDVHLDAEIFRSVWAEAAELRRSGKLLALAGQVRCPTVAIHGDHDPHPAAGVEKPLRGVLGDFRFVLLEHCGHTPWIERWAGEVFYRALDACLIGQ